VRTLIRETRTAVAVTINAGLTFMYWRIGNRIRQDILGGKRAGYGEQIVHALSAQLRLEFG
jgi:predicted HAD superfamily phosphohydrolase YqeG